MALSASSYSKPSTRSDDVRALRFRIRDVDMTGITYQNDDSETTVSAGDVGLAKIEAIIPCGIALAADKASGCGVGVTVADDGQTATLTLIEAAATGLALLRKTDAEAVPTGLNVRCLIIGY